MGVLLQCIRRIYAIIAGFLLITVLTRYSELSQICEAELNAVECIRDFLVYLDDSAEIKRGINEALLDYVRSVSGKEWVEMSQSHSNVNSDTSEELYRVMRACKKVELVKETDVNVVSALIENVADITKARTRRICLANEKLPPRLQILVVFMSAALVTAFALMGVNNIWIHVLITVAVALCVHLLQMIIEDLDHPFYGIWNIDKSGFANLQTRFEGELGRN